MTRFHIRLVVGFGLFLAATSAVRAEVLIGLATPLTGHMAWAGASNQVGAESAVADINAKGGVLGERIALTVVDDACDLEQASPQRKSSSMLALPWSLVIDARSPRFRPRESTPRPVS